MRRQCAELRSLSTTYMIYLVAGRLVNGICLREKGCVQMAGERSRNVFVRHPFIFGATALLFAALVFSPESPKPKKLDYSKPIYTAGSAILCPQSLFLDLRADHDALAIFEVFTSFLHRDEKARALGCEVVREGIPVTAYRMDEPFHHYVAVSFAGHQDSTLFTMEPNLENDETRGSFLPVPTTPFSLKPGGSMEAARLDFQKHLSTFTEPMPNLRWVPLPAINPHPDGQEDAMLVTPFGFCADLTGNAAATGYAVVRFNQGLDAEPGKIQFVGGYDQTRSAATKAAERYCHDWYTVEASKSQGSGRPMWFTPDMEEVLAPQTAVAGSSLKVEEVPVPAVDQVPSAPDNQDLLPGHKDSKRVPVHQTDQPTEAIIRLHDLCNSG